MPKSGTYFRWHNGIPIPVDEATFGTPQISSALVSALACPYHPARTPDGELVPGEERWQHVDGSWMLNGEVAAIKLAEKWARGDIEAGSIIMDRIIGKPKQQIESINMNITYQDFLDKVRMEESKAEAEEVRVYGLPDGYTENPAINTEDMLKFLDAQSQTLLTGSKNKQTETLNLHLALEEEEAVDYI